jgi:hypothetical protein
MIFPIAILNIPSGKCSIANAQMALGNAMLETCFDRAWYISPACVMGVSVVNSSLQMQK